MWIFLEVLKSCCVLLFFVTCLICGVWTSTSNSFLFQWTVWTFIVFAPLWLSNVFSLPSYSLFLILSLLTVDSVTDYLLLSCAVTHIFASLALWRTYVGPQISWWEVRRNVQMAEQDRTKYHIAAGQILNVLTFSLSFIRRISCNCYTQIYVDTQNKKYVRLQPI